MKKRIMSVLMAATLSLNLLACGASNSSESATDTTNAETTTIISESENTSLVAETESRQNDATVESENIETTEVVTEVSTEPLATEEVSVETENLTILPLSYEDFNVNGFGYSNYVDLYGAGNGYDDVKRISIMATNCTAYTEYPDEKSSDAETSRGIKLGNSREQVIAAYGEPQNEVVYKNKSYNHDGLESQYNLCYSYIDERYPEVFFNLSFSMDQNDNVLDISYEAILMKWYK